MTMTSACLTPTLFIGDPGDAVYLTNVTPVVTVDEAVAVIQAKGRALLPLDAWDDAAEVMRRLGIEEPWIENRLRFAKTAMP